MNLEELRFSRLIKGCIVKVKYPVEVQCQADIRRYSKVCKNSRGWGDSFSLFPGEYYKVFATVTSGGETIVFLDIVKDCGYIQPWVSTKFLTLDDECDKYNEEIFRDKN